MGQSWSVGPKKETVQYWHFTFKGTHNHNNSTQIKKYSYQGVRMVPYERVEHSIALPVTVFEREARKRSMYFIQFLGLGSRMILVPTTVLLGVTDVKSNLALHTIVGRLSFATRAEPAKIFRDSTLRNGGVKSLNVHRSMNSVATKCVGNVMFRSIRMQP